jgi:hypothetical protein
VTIHDIAPIGRVVAAMHGPIQHMKRFWLVLLVSVALLVAYWAWPFFGLRSLAAALQSRDAAALTEQVVCGFGVPSPSRSSALISGSPVAQISLALLEVHWHPRLAALLLDHWVAEVINQHRILAGSLFDYATNRCSGGRAVPASIATLRLALEADRS